MLRWVEIGEVSWGAEFAGVEEGVGRGVVIGLELVFERGWQSRIGVASVGEEGGAACPWGWDGVGEEEGVGGAAGVEGGVDVPEGVALGVRQYLIQYSSMSLWKRKLSGLRNTRRRKI